MLHQLQYFWTLVATSLRTSNFFHTSYPHVQVQSLDSILDDCDSFWVRWGNTTDKSFEGGVEMVVQVGEAEKILQIKAPFLVTCNELSQPIVGLTELKV